MQIHNIAHEDMWTKMNYDQNFHATFEIMYCPIEQTVFYFRRILICVFFSLKLQTIMIKNKPNPFQ